MTFSPSQSLPSLASAVTPEDLDPRPGSPPGGPPDWVCRKEYPVSHFTWAPSHPKGRAVWVRKGGRRSSPIFPADGDQSSYLLIVRSPVIIEMLCCTCFFKQDGVEDRELQWFPRGPSASICYKAVTELRPLGRGCCLGGLTCYSC